MENTASTVEMDRTGFDDLQNKILDSKNDKSIKDPDIREKIEQVPESKRDSSRKFVFKRGEEAVELDDDFELELMADKKPIRLTLKELKDRAAGDIAVKNRMHSLAEEKKRIQSTFKQFAELAKEDPLAALEYISGKANEADGEFEYNKYLEKLAEQAERIGQMDDKDRKALELEKKLKKAETDLSLKEREENVVRKKQDILSRYPEIGDSQFGQMVDAVLNSDELLEGVETEEDVMNKVEELVQETLTQRDIMQVIESIDPSYVHNNDLIFALSDQIRQNPDLNEEDITDIIREVIAPTQKRIAAPSDERQYASRVLSSKARQSAPVQHMKTQNMSEFDLLKSQLLEKQDELRKTPLYKR